MATINAIYENGVFRPTDEVGLPDNCRVQLVVHPFVILPAQSEGDVAKARSNVHEILGRRFDDDGPCDLAARHNEHQP